MNTDAGGLLNVMRTCACFLLIPSLCSVKQETRSLAKIEGKEVLEI